MVVQEGDILDGRFELGRVAASGGMGLVFRATDRQTGALVAVKTLRGVEGADRFRREVQLLAALHHPAIVAYLAHGQCRGELYLVTEWLEGEDLGARLAGAEVSVNEAVGVGLQIASALAAAHAQGIVHRDIKPSNVFLADWRLDRVKLLDYGIARQSGSATLTELGMVVGTPAYMAPEQARGERGIDARADVYALGALLFHCLTGRPPFEAEGHEALLAAVLQLPAPRVGELATVPRALESLIARMLDKDPQRRPPDGGAVWAELTAVGRGTDFLLSAAGPTPPSLQAPAAATARRALSSVAVLPFHDMSAARDHAYLCEGIAEELINTLTTLSGLRVTARSLSFALRPSDADARSIGQRLGVDAVLEGGVRKAGDRLRITVQLVDVAAGSPRWSHRFDGDARPGVRDAGPDRHQRRHRAEGHAQHRGTGGPATSRGPGGGIRALPARPAAAPLPDLRLVHGRRARVPAGDRDRPGLRPRLRRSGAGLHVAERLVRAGRRSPAGGGPREPPCARAGAGAGRVPRRPGRLPHQRV